MMMKTNDNIERLLEMIEHREQYSDEEFQKMLEDDDCRECYELMVKTDSAYSEHTDVDAEQALHDFRKAHHDRFSWHKIAAIFIGILLLSGIAYAAIILQTRSRESATKSKVVTEKVDISKVAQSRDTLKKDTVAMKGKSFDDVELCTILNDISAYYGLKVEYGSEKSKHLRLHFNWDMTQDADKVVESLNHFENVNIILSERKINVE
jgi:hypothetical protein